MIEKIEAKLPIAESSDVELDDDCSVDGFDSHTVPDFDDDDWSDLVVENEGHSCPLCSVGQLLSVHRGNLVVWQCNNDSVCLYETGDYEGRPLQRFTCNACCRPLNLSGDYGGVRRWACSGYFEDHRPCETAHPNVDGRPAYHLGQRLGKRIGVTQSLPRKEYSSPVRKGKAAK